MSSKLFTSSPYICQGIICMFPVGEDKSAQAVGDENFIQSKHSCDNICCASPVSGEN